MMPPALGKAIGRARRLTSPAEVAIVSQNLHYLGFCQNSGGRDPASRAERVLAGAQDPLVEQTFDSFGMFVVEFFRGLSRSPEQIAGGWQIRGWEHIERLNRRERGWILAGAHTGNWEHLGAIGPLLKRPIVAPTGRQFFPLLSGVVKEAKRRRAVQSVSTRHGLRGLLSALDQGSLVALPLDGGSFQRGVAVHLLGRRVRLADGAARLSLLGGVPILPVFSYRTAFMEQSITIHPPLDHAAADSISRRQVTGIMEELATLVGHHLLTCPGQWCIFRSILPGRGEVRWTAPVRRTTKAQMQPTV